MPKKTPTNAQVMDRQMLKDFVEKQVTEREQLLKQLHYQAALGEDIDNGAREELLEQLRLCLNSIASLVKEGLKTRWVDEYEVATMTDVTPSDDPEAQIGQTGVFVHQRARRRSS